MSSRNYTVDVLKGIGIILVVMGHLGVLSSYIYMFHMPLFFILAGWCFKEEYVCKKITFCKKRIVALYVPFVCFSCIAASLNENIMWNADLIKSIVLMKFNDKIVGGLWFLRDLLKVQVLVLFLFFFLRNKKKAVLYLLLFCFLLAHVFSLLGISTASLFYLAFFYLIGFSLKRCTIRLSEKRQMCEIFLSFASLILLIVATNFKRMIVTSTDYTTFGYYAIVAMSGCFFCYHCASLLSKSGFVCKIMTYIGKRTMPVFLMHVIVFHYIAIIMQKTNVEIPNVLDKGLMLILGVIIPIFIYEVYLYGKCRIYNLCEKLSSTSIDS